MIREAPYRPAVDDHRQSDRPGADDRDHVAGLDATVLDPDLKPGREDVRQHHALRVADRVGHLVQRRLGVRHAHELGLGAVDQVTEHPANPRRALVAEAVREDPLLAEAAATARLDARDDHLVADRELGHVAAELDDLPDALVAEDPTRRHGRYVPLHDVQIGAADRRRVDPDDGVGRLLDLRFRHVLPGLLAGSVIHERFHGVLS